MWYKLTDDHTPVSCTAAEADALLGDVRRRRVGLDKIGDVTVATVFLCLDHNILGDEPVLFETMVYGDGEWTDQERYSTWAEAVTGHARVVARVHAERENKR
jgi:hypothetical protein